MEGGGGARTLLKNRCSNLNPKSKMATNIKSNWLNLTVTDLNIMNNTFICLECVQGNSV